jgi:RimJ/RimL family protein N-acetyltransferase
MLARVFQLETERLSIRPWQPGDRAAFVAIHADSEVTRYLNAGVPFNDQEVDGYLERQARQLAELDMCMGALVEKSSGQVIGVAGVQPLGTTGDLEIGWTLARRAWGRGYAREAGRAAMAHVLETLERPRVVAIIDCGNEASKRVAAALGMAYDRTYTGSELGHRLPEIVVERFYRERAYAAPL